MRLLIHGVNANGSLQMVAVLFGCFGRGSRWFVLLVWLLLVRVGVHGSMG